MEKYIRKSVLFLKSDPSCTCKIQSLSSRNCSFKNLLQIKITSLALNTQPGFGDDFVEDTVQDFFLILFHGQYEKLTGANPQLPSSYGSWGPGEDDREKDGSFPLQGWGLITLLWLQIPRQYCRFLSYQQLYQTQNGIGFWELVSGLCCVLAVVFSHSLDLLLAPFFFWHHRDFKSWIWNVLGHIEETIYKSRSRNSVALLSCPKILHLTSTKMLRPSATHDQFLSDHGWDRHWDPVLEVVLEEENPLREWSWCLDISRASIA